MLIFARIYLPRRSLFAKTGMPWLLTASSLCSTLVSRILKHLGLWPKPEPVRPSAGLERGPPAAEDAARADYDHYFSDPIADYDVSEVEFTE